jgi:hypothetical protein
VRLITIPPKIL